jgi:hypothetical protein
MSNKIKLYGIDWQPNWPSLMRELQMIQRGGGWQGKHGTIGNGLEWHFRKAIEVAWPWVEFNKWMDLFIHEWLTHRTMCAIGPASSGKTFDSAVCHLIDYYAFPNDTTIIICSTTKERLEDRIWGEIKKLHRDAKRQFPWLPGNLIEGRQRIVTSSRYEVAEGRDFRNGIIGVPCKKGGEYTGLGDFVGIKNRRVRLCGDELQLLPRVFVDSVSNLDKNPDFKATGLGNPKDTTDALGVLAEPSAEHGGWDGGIDQTPITKTWPIRRPNGVCVQFVGSDSPNLDGKMRAPLITQAAIDRDVAFYGKDSVWFTMMNQGMMPKGQGAHRILTRQMCRKFGAMEEPVWKDSNRTKILFLDAAFKGSGGDRCVWGELDIGNSLPDLEDVEKRMMDGLLSQETPPSRDTQIMALIETGIVPIKNDINELPEDQIVNFMRQKAEERGIPPDNMFYDGSMRSSLVSAFSRVWSPSCNALDFLGKATDRQVSYDMDTPCNKFYANFVTEMWYSARMIVEAGQFRGMTEEVMLEGCQREWGMSGGNLYKLLSKDEMKELTGRSPDLFDALVCGIEGARRKGFVIKRMANRRVSKESQQWKRELRERAKTLWRSKELSFSS